MNHFMLPADKAAVDLRVDNDSERYGKHAMEMMINAILKAGGLKKNLEVKLCGRGRVLAGMTTIDVGKMNIDFIRQYVELEKLMVATEDLGDIYPRKVLYFPQTGRVLMKKLRKVQNDTLAKREKDYSEQISQTPTASDDIESF